MFRFIHAVAQRAGHRSRVTWSVAAVLAVSATVLAPAPATLAADDDPLHMEDRAYLAQTLAASRAQVAINQLAVEKAADEEVRTFAQELLDAYSRREGAVLELAAAHGLAGFEGLDPVTERRLVRLGALEGAAFDATYLAGQVPILYAEQWVHRRFGRHGTKADIIAFAKAETLPIDTHHEDALPMAKAREDAVAGTPHPEDATLLTFAMGVDLAQVALADLAIKRARSDAVRGFAEAMKEGHAAFSEIVTELAADKGVEALEAPGPMEVALLTYLTDVSDAEFDLEYMRAQVIFHDNWYKRFEHTEWNGVDDDVRAFAAQGHTVGTDHHDHAYAIIVNY